MTDPKELVCRDSAVIRRTMDAAVSIGTSEPDGIDFQHAVLCQVGIPRSKTPGRVFERHSGFVSVRLEAGALFDGENFIEQPLPYGTRPRLTLVYASGYALRHKTREIDLGPSLRDFMRRLGLEDSGGERGNYRAMREQIQAFAACRMTIGMNIQGRAVTLKTDGPVEQFEAWLTPHAGPRRLCPASLRLSEKFYESLQDFSVPLDPRALAALKDSALGMDVYMWLAHRMCRIKETSGIFLPWTQLREQFGQEYAQSRDFKKKFVPALQRVIAVYPAARIHSAYGGLQLYPSLPPIAKVSVLLPARPSAQNPPSAESDPPCGATRAASAASSPA
jgi:drug/metabolite transporter superfamily protein YnfA